MNKYLLHVYISAILILLCAACKKTTAESHVLKDSNTTTLFDKLYASEKLSLIINTDFQSLLSNKSLDGNHYQKATITVTDNGQNILEGTIMVRPRGITRRNNCEFPPLMLKVKKDQLDSINIDTSENIKLVTFCKDSVLYQQWVIKEYLAYKLYNTISEHSFNAKLAEIVYEDSRGQYPNIEKTGFVIEPLDELAERVRCKVVSDDTAIKTIHREKYKLLTMFQYMIGNPDWNFSKRHNIRLLACEDNYGPIPVPYDFDFSGLVNASYAKPHPMLPIDKVTDRLFLWRGSVDEDFTEIINIFHEKRNDFQEIYNNADFLMADMKKEIDEYILSFYSSVSSPEYIKKEILKARRK